MQSSQIALTRHGITVAPEENKPELNESWIRRKRKEGKNSLRFLLWGATCQIAGFPVRELNAVLREPSRGVVSKRT